MSPPGTWTGGGSGISRNLDRHLEWAVTKGGAYRTRQSHEQPARSNSETAYAKLVAEEAVDDPLRMVPFLLTNEAVAGRVLGVDLEHRERTGKSRVRRTAQVELEVAERCTMPLKKKLYWTHTSDGREYLVTAVRPAGNGPIVTLTHQTGSDVARARSPRGLLRAHDEASGVLQGLPGGSVDAPSTGRTPRATRRRDRRGEVGMSPMNKAVVAEAEETVSAAIQDLLERQA